MRKNKKIILIVGASGSGKSTLEKKLIEYNPSQYYKAVSMTTRKPRGGETNGVDYYFVSREEFDNSALMESVEFAGNKYGLPASEIHSEKDTVVVVEPHGAKQILEYIEEHSLEVEPILIYFDIPQKVRIENMRKRGDSEESIRKRIQSDSIAEDWKKTGLKADLTIKKLSPFLHMKVDEFIRLTRLL